MDEDKDAPKSNGDSPVKKEEEASAEPEGEPPRENGARMDVDDEGGPPEPKPEVEPEVKKPARPESVVQTTTADEDDAVEY